MGEIYSKADQSQTPNVARQQAPQSVGGGRAPAYPAGANVSHAGFPTTVNSGSRNTVSGTGGGGGKYESHYRRDGTASQHGPPSQPPAPQNVPDPHLLYARNPGCAPTVVPTPQYKPNESLVALTQAAAVGTNSYLSSVAPGSHRVNAPLQVQAPLLGAQGPPQPPPGSSGVQQQSYLNHHSHTQKRPQLNPNKRHRIDFYGGHPAHAQLSSHREPPDSKASGYGGASAQASVSQMAGGDMNRYSTNSQPPPPRESAYHPQVEAISPALEEVRLDPNLQKEKNEVAETLQRMEREITNTDKQLKQLRSKQALLESRINQQGEDQLETSDDEDIVEERRFHNPFEAVTAENRRRAMSARKPLEDHLKTWRKDSLSIPLYHQPSDLIHVSEEKKRYKQFKPRLIEWLSRRQAAERKRLTYLASQYDKYSRSWVKKQEKFLNSHKRRNKEMKWRECFEKNFPDVKKNREEYERWKQEGFEMNEEYASNAFLVYHDVDKMKDYAIDPPITLPPWLRRYRYMDRNGIVRDPLQQHETAQDLSLKWTAQERSIFKDRYLNFPKNFSAIASYLEKKTVADCIQFYYLTKKSENYKQLVKRHHSKRRRVQQERQLQRQHQQHQQPPQQQQPNHQQPHQPSQQQQTQQQHNQQTAIKQEKTEVMDTSSTCSAEALKGIHKREPDQDDDANGPAGSSGGNASNGGKSFSQANSTETSTVNSLKIKSSSPSSNSDRISADGHAPAGADNENAQATAANASAVESESESGNEPKKESADVPVSTNLTSSAPSVTVSHADVISVASASSDASKSADTSTVASVSASCSTPSVAIVSTSAASASTPEPSAAAVMSKTTPSSTPAAGVSSSSSRGSDAHGLNLASSQSSDGSRERKSSGSSSVSRKSPEKSSFFHDRNTISDLIQNAIENNLSMDTWSLDARNISDRLSPSKRASDSDSRTPAKDSNGPPAVLYPTIPSQAPTQVGKEALEKTKWRQPIINGPPLLIRPDFPLSMQKLPGGVGFVHSQLPTSRQLGVPSAGLHPSLRTSPLRVDTSQDITDGASLISRQSAGGLTNPRPSPQAPGGSSFMSAVGWPPSSQADLSDSVYRMRSAAVPNYPSFSAGLPLPSGQGLNPHLQVSENSLFNRSVLVNDFASKGNVSKLAPQRPVTHLNATAMPLQNRLQPEYYVGRALDPNMLPQPQPMKPIPTSSTHHPTGASVRPLAPTIPSALMGSQRPVSHIQTSVSGMCVTLAQPTPTHLSSLPSTHKSSLPLPTLQPLSRPGIDPEAYKQDCFNRQAELRYRQEVEPFLFRERSDSERTRTSSEASQIYDLIKRRPRTGASGMAAYNAAQRQPPNGTALSATSGLQVPRSQEQTQMPPPVGVPQRSSSFSRKPEFSASSTTAPVNLPPRESASSSFERASPDLTSTSAVITEALTTTTSTAAAVASDASSTTLSVSSVSRHGESFSSNQAAEHGEEEKEGVDESSHEPKSSRTSPRPQGTPTSKANSQEKPITAASLIDAIIVSQISQPEGASEERDDDSEHVPAKVSSQTREPSRETESRLLDKQRLLNAAAANSVATPPTGTMNNTLPIKKSTSMRPMQITLVDRINQVIAEDYGNPNVTNFKEQAAHSSEVAGSSSTHSEDAGSVRQHPSHSGHEDAYPPASASEGQDDDVVITKTHQAQKVDSQTSHSQMDNRSGTPSKQVIDLDSQMQEMIVKHVSMDQLKGKEQTSDEKRSQSHSPSHDLKMDHHRGGDSSALGKSDTAGSKHDYGHPLADGSDFGASRHQRANERKSDMESAQDLLRMGDKASALKENISDDHADDKAPEEFILHKRRKVYDQVQRSNKQRHNEMCQRFKMQCDSMVDTDEHRPGSTVSQIQEIIKLGKSEGDSEGKEHHSDPTSSSMLANDEVNKSPASSTMNLLHHALSNKQPLSLVEPVDQLSHDAEQLAELAYRKRSNSDMGSIRTAVRLSDYERLRETTQRIAIVTKATSAIGGFNSNKVNSRHATASAFFRKHVDPKIEYALEQDDPSSSAQSPDQSASSPKKAVGSLIVTSSSNNESSTPSSSPDNTLKRRALESVKSAQMSSVFRPPKKRYEHEATWYSSSPDTSPAYLAQAPSPRVETMAEDTDCDNAGRGLQTETSLHVSDESESPSKFSARPPSDQASDRASVGSCSSQDIEGMSDTSEDGALQIDLEAGVTRPGPPPLTAVTAPTAAAAGFGDK